jgi:hypothetical protein
MSTTPPTPPAPEKPSWTAHPWFIPAWRRWGVVLVCLLWSGLETAQGETFWATLAFILFGYTVWALLLRYRPPHAETPPDV